MIQSPPRMPRKPLKRVGNYYLGDAMGEGAYGKVREGVHGTTMRRVAMKIVHRSRLRKIKKGMENLRREIRCLKLVKHKNVVDLIEVVETDDKIYLVFEYVTLGSVQQLVEEYSQSLLPLEWTRSIFWQMLDGLEACHSKGVVHRDIKPANLLILASGIVKISDFGVAEVLDQWEDDRCGTWSGSPAFQAPELCAGSESVCGPKLDIWAAGVTLYLLAFGKAPFEGATLCQLFENITKAEFEIPQNADPRLADLIRSMLTVDVEKRPTIDQIKRHEWMQPPPPLPKPPQKENSSTLMQRLMDEQENEDSVNSSSNSTGVTQTSKSHTTSKQQPLQPHQRVSRVSCDDDDNDNDDDDDDRPTRKLPGEDYDPNKKCCIQ